MQVEIDCNKSKCDQIESVFERVQSETPDRQLEIETIMHIARVARDGAAELGLKFETYLLDMSVVALKEQLETKKVDN